jgi:myo-inositol 2-dehydrogenase/D-chiro-inositol 1-dehydrogenase
MAVIGRSDVDAVLIASPDETHAPLTLAAIAAGKDRKAQACEELR